MELVASPALFGCVANFGCGTVFELTASGGGWAFNVLHTFDWLDGATPVGLTFDNAGNLYGNAELGANGEGDDVMFQLSQSGGIWVETVLHSFSWGDGSSPQGDLLRDQHGTLYGVAANGGLGSEVVFRIRTVECHRRLRFSSPRDWSEQLRRCFAISRNLASKVSCHRR